MFSTILRFIKAWQQEKEGRKYLQEAEELFEREKYSEALDSLQKARERLSLEGKVSFLFARIYVKEGKWDSAILEYKRAIEDFLTKGKDKDAVICYEEFMHHFKNPSLEASLLFAIASAYERLKYYKLAIQTYEKLIKEYPFGEYVEEALFNIAELYFKKLEDIDSALFYYKTLIDKFPQSKLSERIKQKIEQIEILKTQE